MAAAQIAPAEGRLGVLLPGLGAVSTTLIAGVELTRKGRAKPIGSLTQLGTIRLGKRTENRTPLIRDFVPLAGIDDLVFGAWDIFPDTSYQSALKAGVVDPAELDQVRAELDAVAPWPAAFDAAFQANPYVVSYLLDPDSIPFDRPPHFALRSRQEAAYVAETLADAFAATEGALEWLATQAEARIGS